jgi:hypothetical protein
MGCGCNQDRFSCRDGNTILSGVGTPNLRLGDPGDFYIQLDGMVIWGPKTLTWPDSGTSIIGPSGTNGNTLLNGTSAPVSSVGNNGDFFLNTSGGLTIYGPKQNGVWPSSGVTLGSGGEGNNTILNGAGSPPQSAGSNGDFFYDTQDVVIYGPKENGVWPTPGVHLVGAPGAQGPSGAIGQAGINGNSILNGTSNPTSNQGNNGDFFLNTATTTLFGPKANGQWPSSGVSLIGQSSGGGGNTTATRVQDIGPATYWGNTSEPNRDDIRLAIFRPDQGAYNGVKFTYKSKVAGSVLGLTMTSNGGGIQSPLNIYVQKAPVSQDGSEVYEDFFNIQNFMPASVNGNPSSNIPNAFAPGTYTFAPGDILGFQVAFSQPGSDESFEFYVKLQLNESATGE